MVNIDIWLTMVNIYIWLTMVDIWLTIVDIDIWLMMVDINIWLTMSLYFVKTRSSRHSRAIHLIGRGRALSLTL